MIAPKYDIFPRNKFLNVLTPSQKPLRAVLSVDKQF